MKECQCGHIHCCHEKEKSEIITAIKESTGKCISVNGILRKFKRKICADCGVWLGDIPL